MNISYQQITEIISRLEFIKGNLIAGQLRDTEQQVKELLSYCQQIEESIINNIVP
jgi:hypothetical protein